jgi:hypothetical protein
MSTSIKGFFAFLVMFTVVSTMLGYAGIERLERYHYPPFHHDGLYTIVGEFPHPSDRVILFLDSAFGRILVWSCVPIVSVICFILVFGQERLLLGFSILIATAALYIVTGFCLFMHGRLDAFDDSRKTVPSFVLCSATKFK